MDHRQGPHHVRRARAGHAAQCEGAARSERRQRRDPREAEGRLDARHPVPPLRQRRRTLLRRPAADRRSGRRGPVRPARRLRPPERRLLAHRHLPRQSLGDGLTHSASRRAVLHWRNPVFISRLSNSGSGLGSIRMPLISVPMQGAREYPMADRPDLNRPVQIPTIAGHANLVAQLCRREARRLRKIAAESGFVPPPGKVDANIARAEAFEKFADSCERQIGPRPR